MGLGLCRSLSSYLFLAHSLRIESLLIPGGKEAHPGFEEAGIALCTLSGGSGVRVCNGAEGRGWATQRETGWAMASEGALAGCPGEHTAADHPTHTEQDQGDAESSVGTLCLGTIQHGCLSHYNVFVSFLSAFCFMFTSFSVHAISDDSCQGCF